MRRLTQIYLSEMGDREKKHNFRDLNKDTDGMTEVEKYEFMIKITDGYVFEGDVLPETDKYKISNTKAFLNAMYKIHLKDIKT